MCASRLDPPSHASMNDRTDVSELIRVLLCFAFVCVYVCTRAASRQLAAYSSPKEQSTSSVCTTSSVCFCGGTATANFRVSRPALGLRAGGVFAAGSALFAVECKVAPWMSLDVVDGCIFVSSYRLRKPQTIVDELKHQLSCLHDSLPGSWSLPLSSVLSFHGTPQKCC